MSDEDNFVIWILKRLFGGFREVCQRVWHDARCGHPITKTMMWATLYSLIGVLISFNNLWMWTTWLKGWIPFLLIMYLWHMYNIYKHGEWYWI